MTGVASSPAGYVAVGYLGGLAGPIEARFWWSPDGRSWRLATLDGSPAGTRAAAVEAMPGGGFVAVGATGDARTADGSAAWTSPDGRTWTRVADQAALRQGVMRKLTAAGGLGLVAVGNSADSTRAVVWRSTDGMDWTVAPDAPSLDNFGLGIEMHDVAWDGTRLVAVGHRLFGTQYPTGVVWVSTDGGDLGSRDRIGRAQPGQDRRGRRGRWRVRGGRDVRRTGRRDPHGLAQPALIAGPGRSAA